MSIITTPSGFKAEILIENAWGPDRTSVGLRYMNDDARKRLSNLFTNCDETVEAQDIAADMQEFDFGIADGVEGVNALTVKGASDHLYPGTRVTDDIPNCLWHADYLLVKKGGTLDRVVNPNTITMLYGDRIKGQTAKETGFAHPGVIADVYNDFLQRSGSAAIAAHPYEIRQAGVELATWLKTIPKNSELMRQKIEKIRGLLQTTYDHIDALVEEGITGGCWIPHAEKRMIVFGNRVPHCNDLIRQGGSLASRSHSIWRRMLPYEPALSENPRS